MSDKSSCLSWRDKPFLHLVGSSITALSGEKNIARKLVRLFGAATDVSVRISVFPPVRTCPSAAFADNEIVRTASPAMMVFLYTLQYMKGSDL